MTKLNVIVLEDEAHVREMIVRHLQKYCGNYIEVLTSFENTDGVLEYIASNPVQIIFTDVKMQGTLGTELISQIPDLAKIYAVVYITAFKDKYENEIRKSVGIKTRYEIIEKNYDLLNLQEVCEDIYEAWQITEWRKETLINNEKEVQELIKYGISAKEFRGRDNKMYIVKLDTIQQIVKNPDDKHSKIVYSGKSAFTIKCESLSILLRKLPDNFDRINGGCIVNLMKIEKYDEYYVYLENETSKLEVTSTYARDFFEHLKKIFPSSV